MIKRMLFRPWMLLMLALGVALPAAAAPASSPDGLIQQLSSEVIDAVKADAEIQAGNINKIMALVDSRLMPYVNFPRMTAIAVGRPWRAATPAQRQKLQDEFKTLLVRTYAGALTQVKDQTVQVRPPRMAADDTDVVVRTAIKGTGDAIQLDYRLEKSDSSWRIYDVNVLGVWLADTSFKSQFSPIAANQGIDALITRLQELNRKAAAGG
jgi:phospholipid transport system substrate-binding protein